MPGIEINDQFVDVDFTKEPRFVFGDLGGTTFGLTSYEQRFGVLSEKEIDEEIEKTTDAGGGLDLLVSRIFDQGQEGSCVANASCQAFEMLQALQYGLDAVIRLSAISLYKQIGRSAQSGAYVPDAWDAMRDVGILPLDTPENRARFGDAVMPATGFSTAYPKNWKITAKMFAGLEAWPITTLSGLYTAGLKYPVVVGRQGHSICYCRPMHDKNRRRIYKYANSWHESWGDDGFGYDTTRQISESARWAYALRSVRAPALSL